VPREGHALDEGELIRYCAANMAYFMVPRYVRRVHDLPRTLSHKVQKYRLREESERDRAGLWDREAAGIAVPRD
jgi:crotonobetaine/carnitine-CoA ligase